MLSEEYSQVLGQQYGDQPAQAPPCLMVVIMNKGAAHHMEADVFTIPRLGRMRMIKMACMMYQDYPQ